MVKTLLGTPDPSPEPNPFAETLAITAATYYEEYAYTGTDSSETLLAKVAFHASIFFKHWNEPDESRAATFIPQFCEGLEGGVEILKAKESELVSRFKAPPEEVITSQPLLVKTITEMVMNSVTQAQLSQEGRPYLIRYFSGSETGSAKALSEEQRYARLKEALQKRQLILGRMLTG